MPARPGRDASPERGVTGESLDALLRCLDPDRARAGAAYGSLRERLARYFEWRGCELADVLADEVLDRVGRRLAAGIDLQADDPRQYIYGVARLVMLEALKAQRKRRAALEDLRHITAEAADGPRDAEEQDRRLLRCLNALDDGQRSLVLRYYACDGRTLIRAREQLAADLGMPLNALRIRVFRLRERLAECLARHGAGREARRTKQNGGSRHS
jgi:DNA-directed RNA polymerase specialized sigma24 family protein